MVKVYLEGEGYRVIHADRGWTAIDVAQRETPLLVILDLMLPDMSGEEAYQELKAIADVPVIMLTAKSSEEERVAGFALGSGRLCNQTFQPAGNSCTG